MVVPHENLNDQKPRGKKALQEEKGYIIGSQLQLTIYEKNGLIKLPMD